MTRGEKLKRALLILVIGVMTLVFPLESQGKFYFSAAPDGAAKLKGKLGERLKDPALNGAITGLSVRKANSGELLYSHFGDTRLHPASNMKLLTGAAALDLLGPDYRFSTEIWTDGKVRGNSLKGNLYLKGKGDPTLLKEDLDSFARELKEKGIHKLDGDLIGDDSWYDDERLSQDLNWSDESYYTGAQVSALSLSPDRDYDAGTVIVDVHPGSKVGEEPKVELTPRTDYVTIINHAKTVGGKEGKKLTVERAHGTNDIIIEGAIPLDGKRSRSWVAVWDPTRYVLELFKKSLEEEGIRFSRNSDLTVGIVPEKATLLTKKESIPLNELFIPFMKLSNNGHGETLVKEMGKVIHDEGSWEKGLAVMEERLRSFGLNTDTIVLRDGSGMSHKNMIPANELSKLLYSVQTKSWFPVFEKSLPVAGESGRLIGGTLRHRMTEQPAKAKVKAKTGSLTGVSTLSGYVTTGDGEKLIFSLMINNYIGDSVDRIEDAIATELARHEF